MNQVIRMLIALFSAFSLLFCTTPAPGETVQPTLTPLPSSDTGSGSSAGLFPSASPTATPEPTLQDQARNMVSSYYTRLVNREHALKKDFVPPNLIYAKDCNTSGNLSLKSNTIQTNAVAMEALNGMLAAAHEEGVDGFFLVSVYRTYAYQQGLWDKKVAMNPSYGSDPDVPVVTAYPGTSEHQLGLAFDITSVDATAMSEAFAKTPQGIWLNENSYKYGFILRYQEGTENLTHVVYEPWHFRYVGVEFATYLYENGLSMEEFYEGL